MFRYRPPHRTRFVVLGVATIVLYLIGCSQGEGESPISGGSAPLPAETCATSGETVTLSVDYGDGAQTSFTAIPWKDGMTALDALRAAQEHPRGIQFEYKGTGATALLTRIDDLKNRGAGGPNWTYRVNGKLADRSFAVRRLKVGDTVLWKFGKSR